MVTAPPLAHSDEAVASPIVTAQPVATLNKALVRVCTCESGQGTGKPQQFDINTGGVLHGKQNHNDIGMCQINVEPRNGNIQQANRLGFDVYTEQGNIKMANWIYKHEGLSPWNWSKGCWGS